MTTASIFMPGPAIGERLATVTGDPAWHDPVLELISGGRSNLTYALTSEAGEFILRRPPGGTLLPRAHDMVREARVQMALAGTDVPVAEIIHLETDPELIGVPFYVMRKVPGFIIRDAMPQDFASDDRGRAELTTTLVETMAALHRLEPEAIGLGDFGRPEGFLGRQVKLWAQQWTRSSGEANPVIVELHRRLQRSMPTTQTSSIVHGDYRLDNCIVAPTAPPRIAAVLDWELSTLGDPLADLGMLLFFWRHAGEPISALTPSVSQLPGFPDRAEVLRQYQALTTLRVDDVGWYEALAHFKYAVIVQGISQRVASGGMGDQDFGDLGPEVAWISEAGLDLIITHERQS